jgi:predicted amidophosphoribosyltransferase
LSKRFSKIDGLALNDHHYLDGDDVCYYFGEYTAGEGHAFSKTNQLILNFKKAMDKKGSAQWTYKELAIQQVGQIFRTGIRPESNFTFVPIPPSKIKGDPLYDDRLVRSLSILKKDRNPDIRELVLQTQSLDASHLSARRPTPDELLDNYIFVSSLKLPVPEKIVIVDDVLTTGCHFKAVKKLIKEHFPGVPVVGLFVARRVPQAIDFDSFF